MRNLLLSVIFFWLLIGCTKESKIILHNDSSQMVTIRVDGEIFIMLQTAEPIEIPYYLNSYLLLGESVKIPVSYEERLYITPQEFKVRLKPGQEKNLFVVQDRAALQINNLSPMIIDQVLMRRDSLSDWSEDLFDGFIEVEDIERFAVAPHYTEIQIIDIFELEYPVDSISFEIGKLTQYNFSGVFGE